MPHNKKIDNQNTLKTTNNKDKDEKQKESEQLELEKTLLIPYGKTISIDMLTKGVLYYHMESEDGDIFEVEFEETTINENNILLLQGVFDTGKELYPYAEHLNYLTYHVVLNLDVLINYPQENVFVLNDLKNRYVINELFQQKINVLTPSISYDTLLGRGHVNASNTSEKEVDTFTILKPHRTKSFEMLDFKEASILLSRSKTYRVKLYREKG